MKLTSRTGRDTGQGAAGARQLFDIYKLIVTGSYHCIKLRTWGSYHCIKLRTSANNKCG
jgi:hypothetical protein